MGGLNCKSRRLPHTPPAAGAERLMKMKAAAAKQPQQADDEGESGHSKP
jgi:hypothetical protein